MTIEERIEALEKEVQVLKDIEAIKELKGRYFRCLDGKDWDGLEETFSPSIETSYSNGKLAFHGPKEVTNYFKSAMPPEQVTYHQGHTPEIEIIDENNAVGKWYLQDRVIYVDGKYKGVEINGAAFYTDRYEKVDGQWLIAETGYIRVFEEMIPKRDPSIRMTANMHAPKEPKAE